MYTWISFLRGKKHFGREKKSHRARNSPSHYQIPEVKSFFENKKEH